MVEPSYFPRQFGGECDAVDRTEREVTRFWTDPVSPQARQMLALSLSAAQEFFEALTVTHTGQQLAWALRVRLGTSAHLHYLRTLSRTH